MKSRRHWPAKILTSYFRSWCLVDGLLDAAGRETRRIFFPTDTMGLSHSGTDFSRDLIVPGRHNVFAIGDMAYLE
jgi:hypothetical protein